MPVNTAGVGARIECLDVRARGVSAVEFFRPPARPGTGVSEPPDLEPDVPAKRNDEGDFPSLHFRCDDRSIGVTVVTRIVRGVETIDLRPGLRSTSYVAVSHGRG